MQSEKYEQQRLKKQFNDMGNNMTTLQNERDKLKQELTVSNGPCYCTNIHYLVFLTNLYFILKIYPSS